MGSKSKTAAIKKRDRKIHKIKKRVYRREEKIEELKLRFEKSKMKSARRKTLRRGVEQRNKELMKTIALTKVVVEKSFQPLPENEWNVIFDEVKCNICYCDGNEFSSRFRFTLNCGHSFCFSCIKEWAKRNRTPQCPNCRADIVGGKLIKPAFQEMLLTAKGGENQFSFVTPVDTTLPVVETVPVVTQN